MQAEISITHADATKVVQLLGELRDLTQSRAIYEEADSLLRRLAPLLPPAATSQEAR